MARRRVVKELPHGGVFWKFDKQDRNVSTSGYLYTKRVAMKRCVTRIPGCDILWRVSKIVRLKAMGTIDGMAPVEGEFATWQRNIL